MEIGDFPCMKLLQLPVQVDGEWFGLTSVRSCPVPGTVSSDKAKYEVLDANEFYVFCEVDISRNYVHRKPDIPAFNALLDHQKRTDDAHNGRKRVEIGKCTGLTKYRREQRVEVTGERAEQDGSDRTRR